MTQWGETSLDGSTLPARPWIVAPHDHTAVAIPQKGVWGDYLVIANCVSQAVAEAIVDAVNGASEKT